MVQEIIFEKELVIEYTVLSYSLWNGIEEINNHFEYLKFVMTIIINDVFLRCCDCEVFGENLFHNFELPENPTRIVSLIICNK